MNLDLPRMSADDLIRLYIDGHKHLRKVASDLAYIEEEIERRGIIVEKRLEA